MKTTLAELNRGDEAGFVARLGHVFEHSPWVAAEAWRRRPFSDAKHLHRELCAVVREAPATRREALLQAHPDLAGRLAAAGLLTASSTQEQKTAGLNLLEPGEAAEFQRLNAAYRERFGFPFIICARLNDRGTILSELQRRLSRRPEVERGAASLEIEKIAWLRLRDALKE